ncbi:ABC transporter permease subunit [Paenibacillus arenilitoris]|uniref:ABC transporter permease subunit n=1 Tax=Paenibacillus arenilitoris TaxID=2772299 RepID=A0A927CHF7_9BACL|nr:ABC transporter permease subunit [Paenibacillus arenilitoris]MBD2868153.1 ABC transporter permease subunit [Paenibacillus arenilitoris]
MNIFWYELKAYRGTTLLWTASLAGIVLLMMAMFPSFAKDADAFREVLQSMPEAVMKAVGLQLDSITSLIGFYSYIFTYVTLCGSIQAMHLGTSILSKEGREKTADFLLAKPVTRGAVFAAKSLAALTLLLLTNAVFFGAAGLIATAVKIASFDFGIFALITLSLLLIQLVFLAIGFAAALLLPRMKTVLPVTLGTVFAFFIISFIGASTGDGKLRYLTPFQYFDRSYIAAHGGYEPEFLIASAVIAAVCLTYGIVRYAKRDVQAT